MVGPSASMSNPFIQLCMPLLIAVYALLDDYADVCLWSHGATFFAKLIILNTTAAVAVVVPPYILIRITRFHFAMRVT